MFVLEPRFVDRVGELKTLRDWCSEHRPSLMIIYGPEGCGKSRLLREAVRKFEEWYEDGVAVYINALEERDFEEAIMTPGRLSSAVDVARIAMEIVSTYGLPVGRTLATSISTLFKKIASKLSLREKRILVAVDDALRAIGLDEHNINVYLKRLLNVVEYYIYDYVREYGVKALSIVVATSEGKSLKEIVRHRYGGAYLIWNLDRGGFKELFHELEPPPHVDFEEVWRVLGGNPGKLVELKVRYGLSLIHI